MRTPGVLFSNSVLRFFGMFFPFPERSDTSRSKPLFLLLLLFLFPISLVANDSHLEAWQEEECEEVLVLLQVDHIGNMQLPSMICGEEIYLSVPGIFDFLHIKHITAPDFTRMEGYFIEQGNDFLIDEAGKQISFKGKTYNLNPEDLIRTRTNLFLKPQYLEEIFGLHTSFTFYNLSVVLTSDAELPSVKAARQAQMRKNIQKVTQEFTVDTVIPRERPFFHFGTLNWNLNLQQEVEGRDLNRLNLGLGGLLAGGDFQATLNYNSTDAFSSRSQFYRWRYINNDNSWLRQIMVGKIAPQSIASIYDPVLGVQLTNAPTQIRKSFGTYTLSDTTEPNWIVELYINNVLVDYVQTDASGFYSFDVPLMYGSTNVHLRFYGPWGEEKVSQKYFNIPFVFLPVNQFEYKVSAGMLEDDEYNLFAKAVLNYGLSRSITLGGGLEYLSTLSQDKELIPSLHTSVKLSPSMLLSAEVAQEVGYNANFSYSSPSRINLELSYSRYEEEQEAVRFSYLEERKALLSVPFRSKYISGTSRFVFRQNLMRDYDYLNTEWILSSRIFGISTNLRTYAFFSGNNDPVMYSNLASSFQLLKELAFTAQVGYNYNKQMMSTLRGELKTPVFKKGYLGISYDRNFEYGQNFLQLSFQYDLPFSRLGFSSSMSKNRVAFTQNAGGGLAFQPQADYVRFSTNETLDRASIKFLPFLDLNDNAERDELEPLVKGVNVRASGGSLKEENPDGSVVFTGLEPHIPHYFEILTHNLQQISWQVKNRSLSISLNPNKMELVEIPVAVMGEIGGYVFIKEEGLGGIRINILKEKELVTSIVSQPDGYFSYLGLKTGNYVVQPDNSQLERLGLQPAQGTELEVINGEDGALIDNLEFFLQEGQAAVSKTGLEGTPETDSIPSESEPVSLEEIKESESLDSGEAEVRKEAFPEHDSLERHNLEQDSLELPVPVIPVVEIPKENDSLVNPGEIILEQAPDKSEVPLFEVTEVLQKATPEPDSLDQTEQELKEEVNFSGTEKAVAKGLVFEVQLAASKIELPDDYFYPLEGVRVYQHEDYYKYTYGSRTGLQEANRLKNKMRTQGFPEAFVVPFFKGQRLNQWQVGGRVLLDNGQQLGLGSIKVHIYNKAEPIGTALSEADGEFRVPDLVPGSYFAALDPEQLKQIHMEAELLRQEFRIGRETGVSLDRLEFVLYPLKGRRSQTQSKQDSQGMIFKVQVLASRPRLSVNHKLLKGLPGVERHQHNGLYKYTWGAADNLQEIREWKQQAISKGFRDAFIVTFVNGKRFNMQEVSGRIILKAGEEYSGLEGIKVEVFDDEEQLMTTLVSGKNGGFSFLGFRPGRYLARLDEAQLARFGLKSESTAKPFFIGRNMQGDERLEFQLTGGTELPANGSSTVYKIQIVASNVPLSPRHPAIKGRSGVEMHRHEGMYKYTLWGTSSLEEARELRDTLRAEGFPEAFVVGFRNGERFLPGSK